MVLNRQEEQEANTLEFELGGSEPKEILLIDKDVCKNLLSMLHTGRNRIGKHVYFEPFWLAFMYSIAAGNVRSTTGFATYVAESLIRRFRIDQKMHPSLARTNNAQCDEFTRRNVGMQTGFI